MHPRKVAARFSSCGVRKCLWQFAHCYCFSAGLRSKRFRVVSEQRETEERRVTGFSVLAARKMERAAIFRADFDPRSSFFALKRHGNACYACFSSACRNGRFLSLPVAGSVSRNVATTGSGERRLYSAAGNSFFSAYETYSGLLQAFVVGMAQKDVIRKNSKNLPP